MNKSKLVALMTSIILMVISFVVLLDNKVSNDIIVAPLILMALIIYELKH